jgi:hypothetical protein
MWNIWQKSCIILYVIYVLFKMHNAWVSTCKSYGIDTLNIKNISTRFFSSWVVIKLWSLTGFPRASLHDLDVSMSVLCFQKDNLLSLTNVCKMYILNTKQIQKNCLLWTVWDDRFWKIIINYRWNSNIIDRFSIIIDDQNTNMTNFYYVFDILFVCSWHNGPGTKTNLDMTKAKYVYM